MKAGVRYAAMASGTIKGRDRALLVCMIFRDGYMEGMLSTSVGVDGTDSTVRIIRMLGSSRFGEQVRILLFNGIAVAGLNIIDTAELERKLKAKVVLLNRRRQDARELIRALRGFSRASKSDVSGRVKLVKDYSSVKPIRANGLFMQSSLESHYVERFAGKAFEALRIAHIVASGLSAGESRGRL
ncbi:MAG: DUF99 family protein [Candidatus Micrarchaeaceae archaeon]